MSKKRVLNSWCAVSIDSLFDGRTFDEVILDLQSMSRRYDKEIDVHDKKVWFEVDNHDDGAVLYVRVDRWETDDEYKQRQKQEQAKKDKAKRAREAKKAKGEHCLKS